MTGFAGQFENVMSHAPADDAHISRRRRPRRAHLGVNLTSLIDVTFLLLIFFMVATSMNADEEAYRMDLPEREGIGGADPFTLDDNPLRILVNSTGLGPNMYELRIDGPYPQPADFKALYQYLNQKQVNPTNASIGSGAMFEPDHPIVIQPTRATRWEHAMEAFNAAARAHYTNVTFATPG